MEDEGRMRCVRGGCENRHRSARGIGEGEAWSSRAIFACSAVVNIEELR